MPHSWVRFPKRALQKPPCIACIKKWVRICMRCVYALMSAELVLSMYYSWIGRSIRADTKSIYRRTRRVTTLLRSPWESFQQGKIRSAWTIFVEFIFDLLFFETSEYIQGPNKNSQSIFGFASLNSLVPRSRTLLRRLGSLVKYFFSYLRKSS